MLFSIRILTLQSDKSIRDRHGEHWNNLCNRMVPNKSDSIQASNTQYKCTIGFQLIQILSLFVSLFHSLDTWYSEAHVFHTLLALSYISLAFLFAKIRQTFPNESLVECYLLPQLRSISFLTLVPFLVQYYRTESFRQYEVPIHGLIEVLRSIKVDPWIPQRFA